MSNREIQMFEQKIKRGQLPPVQRVLDYIDAARKAGRQPQVPECYEHLL